MYISELQNCQHKPLSERRLRQVRKVYAISQECCDLNFIITSNLEFMMQKSEIIPTNGCLGNGQDHYRDSWTPNQPDVVIVQTFPFHTKQMVLIPTYAELFKSISDICFIKNCMLNSVIYIHKRERARLFIDKVIYTRVFFVVVWRREIEY